jgi:hypothetical protein
MLMSEKPTVAVPAAIEEAQLQFDNWRRERRRGERIPEDLWATAMDWRSSTACGPQRAPCT